MKKHNRRNCLKPWASASVLILAIMFCVKGSLFAQYPYGGPSLTQQQRNAEQLREVQEQTAMREQQQEIANEKARAAEEARIQAFEARIAAEHAEFEKSQEALAQATADAVRTVNSANNGSSLHPIGDDSRYDPHPTPTEWPTDTSTPSSDSDNSIINPKGEISQDAATPSPPEKPAPKSGDEQNNPETANKETPQVDNKVNGSDEIQARVQAAAVKLRENMPSFDATFFADLVTTPVIKSIKGDDTSETILEKVGDELTQKSSELDTQISPVISAVPERIKMIGYALTGNFVAAVHTGANWLNTSASQYLDGKVEQEMGAASPDASEQSQASQ